MSASKLDAPTPAPALQRHVISPSAGKLRRSIVLVVMCLAMFIDAFNTGAMIICLNSVRSSSLSTCSVPLIVADVDWH